MDEQDAAICIDHIRTAARLCEEAGLLAAWATLLSVADDLVERVGRSVEQD